VIVQQGKKLIAWKRSDWVADSTEAEKQTYQEDKRENLGAKSFDSHFQNWLKNARGYRWGAFGIIATGKAGFDVSADFASNGYGPHSPGGYSLLAALITSTFNVLSANSNLEKSNGARLSSHAPVVGVRDAADQARVGSFRAANAKLQAHVAISLCTDKDRDFLLASASGDRSVHFVCRGNLHAFVLRRVERRVPGFIERAGSRRVIRSRLLTCAAVNPV
jgi:hypothetical protein